MRQETGPTLEAILHQQRMGKTQEAESLLGHWITQRLPPAFSDITEIQIVSSPTSLNSVNGHFCCGDKKFFFKAHIEEQGTATEYQNAALLKDAGYPVLAPLTTLSEGNHQLLIYPYIELQPLFEVLYALESGGAPGISSKELLETERREAERIYHIYMNTFGQLTTEENAGALIHQLFWRRLTEGRLQTFYTQRAINLLISNRIVALEWQALCQMQWVINGRTYHQTLGELLRQATQVLDPFCPTISVIGHGDAHYGNIFWDPSIDGTATPGYRYFDPAFAGRHSPLLDVVKPLFHNVFAQWMYFPEEIAARLHIDARLQGDTLTIAHDYIPSPIRQAILKCRIEHTLKPLVRWLRDLAALPDNWLEVLKSALLCCPLLTVNLANPEKIPSAVALLGFAFTIEMGGVSYSGERSLLDAYLAQIIPVVRMRRTDSHD